MSALAVAAGLAAAVASGLRWLRVAQREHYLAGSASRFAVRWWGTGPNLLLALAVVLGIVLAARAPLAAVAGCAALAVGPFGLSLRGRTSPLAWTRRLRTLAAVWAGLHLLVVAVGVLVGAGPTVAGLAAALTPVLVDGAMALTAPLERRLAEPWIAAARARLAEVAPAVVAVTGSYGKTTTKGYIAHLVAGTRSVVPTPASFNNRAGLARAVNENLTPGTEVFVAEMGTYGRGEIAELCSWCPPDVGVICAIGPVHLERMGTEEGIVEAKAELLERARVAVLNVDHPLLADLARRRKAAGQRVVSCSGTRRDADVAVVDGEVLVGGNRIGTLPPQMGAAPTNVACAVAAALELGVGEAAAAERLSGLPGPPHRLSVSRGLTGATVLDDTYNATPAGAAAALAALGRHSSPGGRAVVVTPGMVELGPVQFEENRRFAAAADACATHLVIVGHTNRRALLAGAGDGSRGAEVVLAETREQAVAWVRSHVGDGDTVLYENDLPDHYP